MSIVRGQASYVEKIRRGDPEGTEEFCKIFYRGIRFFVARHLGPEDAEDQVQDVLLIVVQAIRRGELRDPACLPGYVRTVVRHLIATYIGRKAETRSRYVGLECAAGANDCRSNPEEQVAAREKVEIMREVLLGLSSRDREVLTRFYLLEQSKPEICLEMGLSETQFRLLKSRAKARFAKLARLGTLIRRAYPQSAAVPSITGLRAAAEPVRADPAA
jgi:RNA polymerase sigma factor (sigma-70 family)